MFTRKPALTHIYQPNNVKFDLRFNNLRLFSFSFKPPVAIPFRLCQPAGRKKELYCWVEL